MTTSAANDEVVTLYGTAAPTLTGPTLVAAGNALSPSGGVNNAAVATAGAYTPGQATSSPTANNWTAETIALTPLANDGITIARPATPTSNDFLVATVTASGLSASGNICAPDDGTWTELGQITQPGSPAVTQATFYSARSTATAESYTFTFQSACSTTGTPLPAAGTAVAVRFTGVNPITPIDEDNTGALIYSNNAPPPTSTGTSLTPIGVTPPRSGDEVLTMYGSGATSLSASCIHQVGGSASATGFCDIANPTANQAYTAPTVTSSTSKPWIVQTIALESASGGCGSSCKYGIEDPGGVGTDYGQAIAAAEKALDTEAATRPTARKVIILLSDGDANTTAEESNPCQYGITQAESAEAMNGNPYTLPGNTWIYAIAYGAIYAQGQSCTDDTGGNLAGLSAQCAMELIADNHVTDPAFQSYTTDVYPKSQICPAGTYEPSDPPERFYNEATGTSLENVFTQVGDSLSTPAPDQRQRELIPTVAAGRHAMASGLGRLCVEAELVERAVQLGRVVVDAEGARLEELVGAVAAAQEADAEHPRAAGGEEIPDGVADDVAVVRLDAERGGAGEEQIRLGLRARDVAAVDHDDLVRDVERRRATRRSRDGGRRWRSRGRSRAARRSASSSTRAGKRPPLGQQLVEDPPVAGLDRLGLLARELAADLAGDRAREEAAAHPDPAVDPPAVDRHPLLGERALPGEDVRVDRVDERAVEVEDQRAGPQPSSVELRHHVLDLGVVLERVGRHVLAVAGLLVAAVGHLGDERDVVVDPDRAELERPRRRAAPGRRRASRPTRRGRSGRRWPRRSPRPRRRSAAP